MTEACHYFELEIIVARVNGVGMDREFYTMDFSKHKQLLIIS